MLVSALSVTRFVVDQEHQTHILHLPFASVNDAPRADVKELLEPSFTATEPVNYWPLALALSDSSVGMR